MPRLKTYNLFLSHAWKYNADYYRLIDLLDEAPRFKYKNYSVPLHDPLVAAGVRVRVAELVGMLDNQIRPVHCVLIISGMYVAHRQWLQREIKLAQEYDKPIIGIVPRGRQNIPELIQEAADTMVGWQTASIVGAIREYSI